VTINWRDFATGAIFVVLGAWFVVESIGLDRGTAARMGPGFFPPLLAGILILLGLGIILRGIGKPTEAIGAVSWRGVGFTLAAPVIFGATVQGLGLVVSLALAAFCSTLASRRISVARGLVITAGLVAFSVLIFSYGLGLPIRLFGPWLPV
jgi:hypothetical protein